MEQSRFGESSKEKPGADANNISYYGSGHGQSDNGSISDGTVKRLLVPFLTVENDMNMDDLSMKLDIVQRNNIEHAPWPAYAYRPAVSFAIAYSENSLFLKYYVNEKFAKAVYANPNEPVYKDSCVEFFISFEEEPEYYNLEFNCAGTCLMGFGKERNDRTLLPADVIRLIRYQALIKPAKTPGADIGWELSLQIPLKVFRFHRLNTLRKKQCRANFYKCGDELPEPHFLSWNNIQSEHPDFHRPEYFGALVFS